MNLLNELCQINCNSMRTESPILCVLCGDGLGNYIMWEKTFLRDVTDMKNDLIYRTELYSETSLTVHLQEHTSKKCTRPWVPRWRMGT